MCEKGQRLRVLVNERLTAAAQEIFALFERTIAEYEEELCRSKEENKRKQQLLDSVLSPQVLLHRTGVQFQSSNEGEEEVGPILYQENREAAQIKEEPELSIKQEEEQVFTSVSVKSEERPLLLQQTQTEENREETEGDQCETEEQFDYEDDWELPFSSSAQQTETGAEEHGFNQVQREKSDSFSKTNVKKASGNNGLTRKRHECPECEKRFGSKQDLKRHILTHTGEKPVSCPVCPKSFTRNHSLRLHMALHRGEKPFSCSVCNRRFTQKVNLRVHMAQHTGDKPFRCSECDARFPLKRTLLRHMRLHSGDKPYSCPYCDKCFTRKDNIRSHMFIHTRPENCHQKNNGSY